MLRVQVVVREGVVELGVGQVARVVGAGECQERGLTAGELEQCGARRGQPRGAHDRSALTASRRYWWTKAMAMLPSPTAAATRLTGEKRTSPQAKTPGTLVSSR